VHATCAALGNDQEVAVASLPLSGVGNEPYPSPQNLDGRLAGILVLRQHRPRGQRDERLRQHMLMPTVRPSRRRGQLRTLCDQIEFSVTRGLGAGCCRFTHKQRLAAGTVKEATNTMRTMAVCNHCQRDLLLGQLVEGPRSPADAHGAGSHPGREV
jgi:hypothetical protein